MKLILGLDVGISSVGWGIIDAETGEVVDAGVRLFTEAAKENNEKRRGFRGGRRLKNRRGNRREELKDYLEEIGRYQEDIDNSINPYYARRKGLTETLNNAELSKALFNISKHRGSALEVADDDEETGKTKDVLKNNSEKLKTGKYVCEVQIERLEAEGKIRGIENNFKSSEYLRELNEIMLHQNLSDEQKEKIRNLIFRKRHFDEGPGSFKSQTIYGRTYNEDGTVKESMIQKMTGKCSIFSIEYRAPKLAPSAEFFNLLNDLNNLRIKGEPIEVELKQEIVNKAFVDGSITPKKIAKILNESIEDIEGFRIDKSGNPLITSLTGFKIFKTIFTGTTNEHLLKEFVILDEIAKILTDTKVIEQRIEKLKNLDIGDAEIEKLVQQTKFVGYHSLSLKAIYILNKEMYETDLNQMQVLRTSNQFEFNRKRDSQKGRKSISLIDNPVLSPVAMRSYRQAIKVVNAVRKKYGELDSIIVETTREKNSAERKSRINETQKYYENVNKKVNDLLKDVPDRLKNDGKLRMKIRLYEEQRAKTAYGLLPIDLQTLINDPYAYEIDHIIPVSVSLDDSINNKVLVSRLENQQKGQNTPYMAFQKGLFKTGSWEEYVSNAKTLAFGKDGISKKKYSYYTYEKDINKYENMKDFIARNLVDTSYANHLIFNTLKNYFDDNEIGTKVHTVKGAATSAFRKRIEKGIEELKKERDADYSHHAIDALIVASIGKMDLYRRLLKDFSIQDKSVFINEKTGEVYEIKDADFFENKYIQLLKNIISYSNMMYTEEDKEELSLKENVEKLKIHFSHQIDTKPNRSVSDQTIYSTRKVNDEEYVVKKYKDIYDKKFFHLAEDIINNEADEKYLMAKHNPQTFEKISTIVNHYYNEFKNDSSMVVVASKGKVKFKFNPLALHLEETGEKITKYAKKGNGPVIEQMNYLDDKLNNCIDISHNYKVTDKRVVLLQISPYRTDFYLEDGKYKFVTVRRKDVRYSGEKECYVIDEKEYKKKLAEKGIKDISSFRFSLHRNEIFSITKKDKTGVLITNFWKFTATNNEKTNQIEVKPIFYYEKKQLMPTIGKDIIEMKKYSVDVLGNMREIKDSVLKLEFK